MSSISRQSRYEQVTKISCTSRLVRPQMGNRHIRLIRSTSLRKALRISTVFLIIAALAMGIYWIHWTNKKESFLTAMGEKSRNLMLSSGLALKDVIVTGHRHSDHNEILNALDAAQGDLVFDVYPELSRQRIEDLGWIRSATVRRQLPGTILIRVVERRPFALWQRDGKVSLIDREGQVISSKVLAEFNALPVIVGEDAPQHIGALVSVLSRHPMLLAELDAATRVSGRRWDITLISGLEIKLPGQGLAEACDLLAKLVIEHQLFKRDVIAIDLRVKDRLVIRLRSGNTAAHQIEGRST